ncbi:MAG: hypothetical protein KAJ23_17455 [Maribacter sp.]|nr:hypothetical protein [Maribacter sp.]
MKKLVLASILLAFSAQAFAQLSEKQLMGTWNYTVDTDQGDMTGVLNFTEKEGKLTGEVATSDYQVFKMDVIELREENVLYFEMTPDYETFTATLKIEGDAFNGTSGPTHTQFEVQGEKQTK